MKKIRLLILFSLLMLSLALAACGEEQEYKITFMIDDKVYATLMTDGKSLVELPPAPSDKDGRTFEGWYFDNVEWTGKFAKDSLIQNPKDEDFTVYGKRKDIISFPSATYEDERTYSLTVSNDTETLDFSEIVNVGGDYTWRLTTDIQGNNVIISKIDSLLEGDNVRYILLIKDDTVRQFTLKIRRKPAYTVSFALTYDETIESQSIEEGGVAAMPPQPGARTGYTFVGWDFDFLTPITETTEIAAIWNANDYRIYYYYNDGTGSKQEQIATYDSSVSLMDGAGGEFRRDGYTITGWNTSEDGEGDSYSLGQVIPLYNTAGNLNLHAVWQIVAFDINYHLDDGTNHADNPNSYTVETDTIILQTPTKDGYSFEGWYRDVWLEENLYLNEIEQIDKGSINHITLYAKFSIENYDITYHLYSAANNNANPNSYTIKTETIVLLSAEKEGYIFEGWFSESTFENEITEIPKGSRGDIDLYAKFSEADKWSITFYIWDDELEQFENMHQAKYKDSTDDFLLNFLWIPEYDSEKVVFDGWYLNSDFSGFKYMKPPKESEGEIDLYAKFSPKPYEITYHLDDGTNNEANPNSYTVETETIVLLSAEKEGHIFRGWFSESTFENEITEIPKGSRGEIELYAKFYELQDIEWSITFYIWDYQTDEFVLQAVEQDSYNESSKNDTLLWIPEYDQEEAAFDGWYLVESFAGAKYNSVAVGTSGDMVYYGRYIEPTGYGLKTGRTKAAEFVLHYGTDNEINLSDYYGKTPIVLVFWSSQSPPCRAQLESCNTVYNENTGAEFLLLNSMAVGDTPTAAQEYMDDSGYFMPWHHDNGAGGKARVFAVYGIVAFPTTIIIDKWGYISYRKSDVINADTLREEIARVNTQA